MTIINNCPALYQVKNMTNECMADDRPCECIDDCIIKQIINKCNEHTKPIRQWTEKGTCAFMKNGKLVTEQCDTICDEYDKDKVLADEILDMLEVEQ